MAATMLLSRRPESSGAGTFGANQACVTEMDAAVLTDHGSFLTVRNDLPDKPLRFLLFSAPAITPAPTGPLSSVVSCSPPAPPEPRRHGEAYALFGHNGAVIAVSEAAARARMKAYEDEGEAFGDPFAKWNKAARQVPLRSLSEDPLVPERLDLSALDIDGLPVATASPTPPSTPEPLD